MEIRGEGVWGEVIYLVKLFRVYKKTIYKIILR